MGELLERKQLVAQIFTDYDVEMKEELGAEQLQAIHADMRLGGISLPQVEESIKYVCVSDRCDQSELFDVLQEMDRRYFLVQNLRWEFSMLDIHQTNAIPEAQAKWLMQMMHGKLFSKRRWEKFLQGRAVPGSGVTFFEIEVSLCNIPNLQELSEEEEQEKREQEERERKQKELERMLAEEKERRRKQREEDKKLREAEEKKRRAEQDKRRKEEEEDRKLQQKEKAAEDARRKKLEEEEERGRREAEERAKEMQKKIEEEDRIRKQSSAFLDELQSEESREFLEAQRLRQLEEQNRAEEEERRRKEEMEAVNDEKSLKDAAAAEKEAEQEAIKARKRLAEATDARSKQEAEEEEKRLQLKAKESRNKRIRYALKVAVKTRDLEALPKAIDDFKKAKLPDDDGDLAAGERLLKEHEARQGLQRAIDKRDLKGLESAINYVKRNGFEIKLAKELIEANKILLQLRRLERIRAEILELKQSTVAEIRSYSKPPPIVHTVMTATFLILGHQEKETKDWKTVQALVGKTGKDGLKRRCLGLEPQMIHPPAGARAKELISQFGLDDVRDVSAGAATFYLWSETMIEELEARLKQKEEEGESPTPPKEERPSRSSSVGPPGSKNAKSSGKEPRSKSVGVLTQKIKTSNAPSQRVTVKSSDTTRKTKK